MQTETPASHLNWSILVGQLMKLSSSDIEYLFDFLNYLAYPLYQSKIQSVICCLRASTSKVKTTSQNLEQGPRGWCIYLPVLG